MSCCQGQNRQRGMSITPEERTDYKTDPVYFKDSLDLRVHTAKSKNMCSFTMLAVHCVMEVLLVRL